MKLWKKIYFVTFILFLVLMNSGIYIVFHMTYRKDISAERNRTQSVFTMMSDSLTRNMQMLEEQDRLGDAQMQTLLTTYEDYYEKQQVKLTCYRGENCIYPDGGQAREASAFGENQIITIFTRGQMKYISITKTINGFEQPYYLSYEQPLTQLTSTWQKLYRIYLAVSIFGSVILAMLLYLVLNRLMRPIGALEKAVEDMGEGDSFRPVHVSVKGRDDIAKLGESFNDMSDRISENLQRMQEEAEKKQEFIDNFAHELKSPLTSIYGFAEYVEKAKVSGTEKDECMQFIMEESRRMLEMSYTLLDMAKLRETELKMEWISAEKLFRQVEYRMQPLMNEKKITLCQSVSETQIYGNPVLLESLFGNLIVNAIHACGAGEEITMEVSRQESGSLVCITDNGCGMSPEQLAHITEPFYRVDKARSRENGGTGLGLSLCRQIVECHQGSMDFTSEVGKGTEVTVFLPSKKE